MWPGKVHLTLWALISSLVKRDLYTWYTIVVVIKWSDLYNCKARCLEHSQQSVNWPFYCHLGYCHYYGIKTLALQKLFHLEWPRIFCAEKYQIDVMLYLMVCGGVSVHVPHLRPEFSTLRGSVNLMIEGWGLQNKTQCIIIPSDSIKLMSQKKKGVSHSLDLDSLR